MATKSNEQWKDEDLDLIMALLEKDYTKAEPKKAPNFPPLYGDEPREEEEPVTERSVAEIDWGEVVPVMRKQLPPEEELPKKKGKAGLVVILVLEIIVLLGLVAWWVQWLL